MLSEHDLRLVLERRGLDAPVRFDEVSGSTNEVALEMARAGAPGWTLVGAGHQLHGRGRVGRTWQDEPGGALLFSLVLRPDLELERGGLLSLLGGVAMARACRDVAAVDTRCRWPNDLMVGEEKVGGILAESVVEGAGFAFVVLGVGVNLRAAPATVPHAGRIGEVEPLALLDAFMAWFVPHCDPTHPAFPAALLAAYRERCSTLGRAVRATTTDGALIEGRAVDVDELGGLLVSTDAGLEVVRFGEIEHLEV